MMTTDREATQKHLHCWVANNALRNILTVNFLIKQVDHHNIAKQEELTKKTLVLVY